MVTAAKALDGINIEALTRLTNILSDDDFEVDALELYAWAKRVNTLTTDIMAGMIEDANYAFLELVKTDPDAKVWDVGKFASVSRYALPPQWAFPEDLMEAERKLKQDKADAKSNGTAIKTERKMQIDEYVHFKVALKKV